ncbi:flavohemoglobin expression-modulating QEGLA motif protein [Allorhodopirellula heiligendammensis]|uniref:Flavohemoglobin expression-modulating QEGLA motif protein n=1 Tax=Allorhodopirellula heiligendammensis TaxID=2714739 RepID=A0A5C6BXP4_9BACT|nr:tyrosine/phenylalanine carboxypeptidase domain-containing protein [Allorhodopirellula heiligendammensis]TWU15584.1 hypothetical protein Poly21_27810 [Allorhodopirellula heiligendammensis]
MSNSIDVLADPKSITSEYHAIAEAVCKRLAKNRRVRRRLPGGGRLRMDRQLPFLCLHRGRIDVDKCARELVTTEAAYLFASSDESHHEGLAHLCSAISSAMQEHFGMFLLVEVWADEDQPPASSCPFQFEIVASDAEAMPSTIRVFRESLESIRIGSQAAHVEINHSRPAGMLTVCGRGGTAGRAERAAAKSGCCELGLRVSPVYRDQASGTPFPLVLQNLRRQLALALRKAIAEFTGGQQHQKQRHVDAFGPSSFVKAVGVIDQRLCEVSESYDFLMQLTPVNSAQAWEGFQESRYRTLPPLIYRHLPYHPNLLKRRLFAIEIERVEDPTLAYLFWEKQDEIDRQLTALRDLHHPEVAVGEYSQQSKVLLGSLQLYGAPEHSLVTMATEILERVPAADDSVAKSSRTDQRDDSRRISAEQFAEIARKHLDRYHRRMNEFTATVEISDKIASGVMVSQDRLLIAPDASIAKSRVKPLLHHEIGTHLLTYFNGRCQPLRQLYAGLAGYEELQEGLAVLAEYLVGGLTRNRIRTLASRVLAVHWMVTGDPFATVFARLCDMGFAERQSFSTTLRVYRGGGLTKDLIYLRGLSDLLDYLGTGHEIDPLYVGKIGLSHVPYVQELRRRGIITAPRILPCFWDDAVVRDRLEACRGKSVLDLFENE